MASSVVAASRTLLSTGIAATASSSSRVTTSCRTGLLMLSPRAAGAAGKSAPQCHLLSSQRSRRRNYQFPATTASASSSSFRAFSLATETKGSIQVGEKLPESELSYLDKDSNVQTVKVSELTEGKKVVIFAVPGAYTPTCTQKHVPGFVAKAEELKSKGVDTIACVSVNDVFVLNAWGESLGIGDKVLMLSDGLANFTKALGAQIDMSDKPVGLGVRSRRYALLADNGVVTQLNLEEGGAFTVSGPDEILKALA